MSEAYHKTNFLASIPPPHPDQSLTPNGTTKIYEKSSSQWAFWLIIKASGVHDIGLSVQN
jgi:hypothetical protein